MFEAYRRSTDFIQAYIFPGGMLPSPCRFRAAAAGAGLASRANAGSARDYARTLRLWRARFDARGRGRPPAAGLRRAVRRLWRYYLMYCEGGFDGGGLDVGSVRAYDLSASIGLSWAARLAG